MEYHIHYGLELYWMSGAGLGATPYPRTTSTQAKATKEPEHPHVRSSGDVAGYHLHALDGRIGHVDDFFLQNPGWRIRYLDVDTREWLPGKHVLMSPTWIQAIQWEKREVTVSLKRKIIQSAPAYEPPNIIAREDELALYKHYGMAFDQD